MTKNERTKYQIPFIIQWKLSASGVLGIVLDQSDCSILQMIISPDVFGIPAQLFLSSFSNLYLYLTLIPGKEDQKWTQKGVIELFWKI